MRTTLRLVMFGVASGLIGVLAGAVFSGNIATLTYWLLLLLFIALQLTCTALDRREHNRAMADFDKFEETLEAHMTQIMKSRPSGQFIHGGLQ